MVFNFQYKDKIYKINDSLKMTTIADLDENRRIIFIDKRVPKKFLEGVAVHEIEKRNFMKKGNTHTYSHNEARKRSLAFYMGKLDGGQKAFKFLEEEEKCLLDVLKKQCIEGKKNLNPFVDDNLIKFVAPNNRK